MHDTPSTGERPPRIGSLFSGYGGLDLAVEHATDGQTIWFSELNDPVARAFSHHWPDVPNLGDITSIRWSQVDPVDVLCGGFPCQDVSTVGKGAGLGPGTRSGLWTHMAEAIDALQPQLVVIENVRGLLSARATRPQPQGATPDARNPATATDATGPLRNLEPNPWHLGDRAARPLRAAGAVLGDLSDLRYDTQWIGLPASRAGAPHHRFRVFIIASRRDTLPHPAGLRFLTRRRDPGAGTSTTWHDRTEPPDHRPRTARPEWLTDQTRRIRDAVHPDRDHLHRWGRYAYAIARWEHITGRVAPTPALLNKQAGPRPAPEFIEWLMGLPAGWITDPIHELTANQQTAALGNGVVPGQAAVALTALCTSAFPFLRE